MAEICETHIILQIENGEKCKNFNYIYWISNVCVLN